MNKAPIGDESKDTLPPRKKRKGNAARGAPVEPGWQEPFLEAIRLIDNVREACRRAGISKSFAYGERKKDPVFAAAWADAREDFLDSLEAEALSRGKVGWLEPVYYKGEKVGDVRKYSDTLLMFRLNAERPEKYRPTARLEHTGAGGGPIIHRHDQAEVVEEIERKLTLLEGGK